jgi:hypothetical protein
LECGFVLNLLASSAWQVAHVSDPTKSAGFVAAVFSATAACFLALAAYSDPELKNPGSAAIKAKHKRYRFIQPSAEPLHLPAPDDHYFVHQALAQ